MLDFDRYVFSGLFNGKARAFISMAMLGCLVFVLACGLAPKAPGKPTVVITYPESGDEFALNQEIVVQSVSAVANGDKDISRVELSADGEVVDNLWLDVPAPSFTASQPWTPSMVGSHVLEIRAYNMDEVVSEPAQVIVTVGDGTGETGPDAGEIEAGTGTPSGQTSAPAQTPPASGTGVADGEPAVVALVKLNVRSGPGTEYPAVGGLKEGQSALITGKNADGTWWQIAYTSAGATRGWVSAKEKYTTSRNASGVSIVDVPLPPTPTQTFTPTVTPTPTDTPTPTTAVLPSGTPGPTIDPLKPVILRFTADRYVLDPGESVTLRWDLTNADIAFLRYEGKEEGVASPGNITVSPARTTVYTLVARNGAGTTSTQLTVKVNSPGQPALAFDLMSAAPWATWTSSYGANVLTWNGFKDDVQGFAGWRDAAQLEDGGQRSRVLVTRPEAVDGGHIVGEFVLPGPIQYGDRFLAELGFLSASEGEARFSVAAIGGDLTGTVVLTSNDESSQDGQLTGVDVDLTPAVGGMVIRLIVESRGFGGQNWAVWVDPRIER